MDAVIKCCTEAVELAMCTISNPHCIEIGVHNSCLSPPTPTHTYPHTHIPTHTYPHTHPHTPTHTYPHTYGSQSMESFFISLKADLRTTVAVMGSSPTVIVSPGISVKHRRQQTYRLKGSKRRHHEGGEGGMVGTRRKKEEEEEGGGGGRRRRRRKKEECPY